jgi:hypothetical protein
MTSLNAFVRASLWWLVPLGLLLVALGAETDWGFAVQKRPVAEPLPEPKPIAATLLPDFAIDGGVAARRETVDRTLFNPTRRPAPTPIAAAAQPRIQRGQFALTGTLVIDGKSTAFLREVNGGKARRVRQGETINGMTVTEVKPDRIRFALGDETEELVLRVATNSRPTPQQAPVAGAPAAGGSGVAAAAGAPPAPGAAPAAPAAQDVGATLAERRRAARAAAAAAQAANSTPDGNPATPAPAPASAPAPAATAAIPAAAAPARAAPVDPAWSDVYQRMQQQPRR